MEIHWRKKKLKDFVHKYAHSNPITARRMVSIKAASSFVDLECDSNGRAHFLKGVLKDKFAIDLEKKGNGKRLICIPKGDFTYKNGRYIKESITEFEVIEVRDYHR